MDGQTTTSRFLHLATQIKDAPVVPVAFSAQESLSTPFHWRTDFLCGTPTLRPDDLLYTPACLSLYRGGTAVRHFHGLIRQLTLLGPELRGQWRYSIDVVPRLWFMTQTVDCRVFPQKTLEEILRALFADTDVAPVDFRIKDNQRKREYVVQLNETDLTFATRLMQEEGWFYFFEHTEANHTLVVANHNGAFQNAESEPMRLSPARTGHTGLGTWNPTAATTHGLVSLRDYDPASPTAKLEATVRTLDPAGGAASRDLFRWPALTTDPAEVERRSTLIMEAAEAHASLVDGTGWNCGFTAGERFVIAEDPATGATNVAYILRAVFHEGSDDIGRNNVSVPAYSNGFSCFPATRPWRESLSIARPLAPGVFVATVVGNDGEEIHTDDLGRVKVRFPWDRRQDSSADTSIWVRVVQPWAGRGWGAQFLPRVGTEVAVSFIDGDIDRPLVLGGLYNGNDPYPFTLPDKKTISGFRTRSTLKGGASNFSELSFDDAIGAELVFVQAEKDLRVRVKANETRTVGGDQTTEIGGDRFVRIDKGDDGLQVDTGDVNWLVKQGDVNWLVQQGDVNAEVDQGDVSLLVKQGDVQADVSLGNVTITADVGSITLQATQSITLKVGGSTVTISQQGVAIKGMQVTSEGQLLHSTTGMITKINGDAMTIVKGGLMMLN